MASKYKTRNSLLLENRTATFTEISASDTNNFDKDFLTAIEGFDLTYRTLCGILYNFVPQSGHPGGSISSGRAVETLLFNLMDYDFANPWLDQADMISYTTGHQAMGLYAMWALRNECVKISNPALLPAVSKQLRLEDLLGFRRNPVTSTPLFKKFQ